MEEMGFEMGLKRQIRFGQSVSSRGQKETKSQK